jgi:hypothetical protein
VKSIIGDIADVYIDYDAICCTTNTTLTKEGKLVMGAGVAKWFRDGFEGIDSQWGQQLQNNPSCGIMVSAEYRTVFSPGPYLVAFPTKSDWRQKSSLTLIEDMAIDLEIVTSAMGWRSVLLPRPGCSNGGLDWDVVKPILEQYLDDRFTVISKS